MILFSAFSLSCSLDYGKEISVKDSVPEFIFISPSFLRFENNKKTAELTADKLEQYKSDSASFASNSTFTTWNESSEIQTQGSCQLLGIDSKNEVYTLFNDIKLLNKNPDLQITAENLKWNAKSEQLTSGKNDTVTIIKEDTQVTGKGFSASSISNKFSFQSDIEGTITQNQEEETPAQATETKEETPSTDNKEDKAQ
ncbi:LPS export ABC transporter periplasmic protein LptC [Treponema sp.]|uniref:LPS export ABC transporter periplasmic protein LptC n=1 Tax=Treponema sp. TaxID=166 RepID=UPI0025F13179|nr:LPS export ABC transporter periplasmic protein LptC [Treponema sp.]MCR5218869.1 LPS export ABC transporter periplasmic protein LptC [Treponema sp.]